MAAIQFRSSAQTRFTDANELFLKAMEQSSSAFDRFGDAVKTVGEDYTRQNNAQLQAMINNQTYEQTQDPEYQRQLANQILQYSENHGGMVKVGEALKAKDEYIDTVAQRIDKRQKWEEEAENRLVDDKVHTYMDARRIVQGIDPEKSPIDYAAALEELASVTADLSPELRQKVFLGVEGIDRKIKDENLDLDGKEISNYATAQNIENQTTKLVNDIAQRGEALDIERQKVTQNGAAKVDKVAADLSSDIADKHGYSNMINPDTGKLDLNQAARAFNSKVSEIQTTLQKQPTETEVAERRSKLKFGRGAHEEAFNNLLNNKGLNNEHRMYLMDLWESGKITPDRGIMVGKIPLLHNGFKGDYEKQAKEFIDAYNKEIKPQREREAVTSEINKLYNSVVDSGDTKAMETTLQILGVPNGTFQFFDALPPALQKASGYNSDSYKAMQNKEYGKQIKGPIFREVDNPFGDIKDTSPGIGFNPLNPLDWTLPAAVIMKESLSNAYDWATGKDKKKK